MQKMFVWIHANDYLLIMYYSISDSITGYDRMYCLSVTGEEDGLYRHESQLSYKYRIRTISIIFR